MKTVETIKVFEAKQVRTLWDDAQEQWYVSIIDVIEILTGTDRPRKYWNDLKKKLAAEGSELSEKIGQFKMRAADGKIRLTEAVNPQNFEQSKQVAQQGGHVAKVARAELEAKTGKKVVTGHNAKNLLDKQEE